MRRECGFSGSRGEHSIGHRGSAATAAYNANVRRRLLALMVLAMMLASPSLLVVCELACAGHPSHHSQHGEHAPASGHAHEQTPPHHHTPADMAVAQLQPHACDHPALLPVLPGTVIGIANIVLATVPVLSAPMAGRAPVIMAAAARPDHTPPLTSLPLRI